MQGRFADGLQFFNTGRFFDAHEVWEDIWRESSGPERRWMQGLVQVAVAMHHYTNENRPGAISLLGKAHANLLDCDPYFRSLDITGLDHDLNVALAKLQAGESIIPLRLRLLDQDAI